MKEKETWGLLLFWASDQSKAETHLESKGLKGGDLPAWKPDVSRFRRDYGRRPQYIQNTQNHVECATTTEQQRLDPYRPVALHEESGYVMICCFGVKKTTRSKTWNNSADLGEGQKRKMWSFNAYLARVPMWFLFTVIYFYLIYIYIYM